jgi:hypothetical protein
VSKDLFQGLFRLGTVFLRSLNFNNVLLALGLFENYYFKNVGAIQIRKSDGKKRSKHGGTHGICTQKKKEKNKRCVTLWPCTYLGRYFTSFAIYNKMKEGSLLCFVL